MLCRFSFVHMFLRERDARVGCCSVPLCRFIAKLVEHERVVLVSYPRSGNTYLRRLLESYTGIVTGSDSRPNRPLCSSLLRGGLRGEGIVDSSVWVVKSHFPERMGYLKFSSQRVILLVRNPWDAIESYFHMGFTGTHDKALHQSEMEKLQNVWEEFTPHEAKVWSDFHEYWCNLMVKTGLPIYVVRYEDLMQRPQETMSGILRFMAIGITKQEMKLSYVNKFKLPHTAAVSEVKPTYAVKKGGVGKSLQAMTIDQVNDISLGTAKYANLFGYQCNKICPTNAGDEAVGYIANAFETFEVRTSEDNVMDRVENSLGCEFIESERDLSCSCVTINEKFSIREETDKFGRDFNKLRMAQTNNGQNPLLTR